jgi:dolichol-phosphate hexosyltransferase
VEVTHAVVPTAGSVIRQGVDPGAFRDCQAVILLPTLNEERGLAETLKELPFEVLRRNGWDARPLVIDGGSTDRTRDVAREFGVPVLEQHSRGKGAAIREGLEWLGAIGVPLAVILDADATYPGRAVLPALELLDSGSDLVIGVRQPKRPLNRAEATVRDLIHRAGNALLNLSAELISGCSLLDICSGFWAVRVPRALALDLRSTDFAIEAELFLKARRSGLSVHQFPIEYGERVGVAKLHAVRDGVRILAAIVKFGRHSVGVATDPLTQRLAHLVRELTLILLIEGPRDVLLLASPARHAEAQLLAARLRRARLATRVTVGSRSHLATNSLRAEPVGRNPLPRTSAIVSMWDAWDESPLAGPEGSSSVTVRFHNEQRQIYIDLPAPQPAPSAVPAVVWSRSGAFRSDPDPRVPRFLKPMQFIAEHLRTEGGPSPSKMLRANGIRVETLEVSDLLHHLVERGIPPRSSTAPPPTPPTGRVGSDPYIPRSAWKPGGILDPSEVWRAGRPIPPASVGGPQDVLLDPAQWPRREEASATVALSAASERS